MTWWHKLIPSNIQIHDYRRDIRRPCQANSHSKNTALKLMPFSQMSWPIQLYFIHSAMICTIFHNDRLVGKLLKDCQVATFMCQAKKGAAMVEREHFKNAPITEAIIDIRVENTNKVSLNTLKEITDMLPENFTEIKEQNRILTEFQIRSDENPGVDVNEREKLQIGYFCSTQDGHNVAQIQKDGFTFSELKPYSDWDTFSGKARKIWEIYYQNTGCASFPRLAVRYINHMEFPLEFGEDFGKFLVVLPKIPNELPQTMANFLTRATITNPEEECDAHITQAFLPPSKKGFINVLLDIDVVKMNNDNVKPEEIWTTLEKLKTFQNDIFFNYTTKEARELFR